VRGNLRNDSSEAVCSFAHSPHLCQCHGGRAGCCSSEGSPARADSALDFTGAVVSRAAWTRMDQTVTSRCTPRTAPHHPSPGPLRQGEYDRSWHILTS
jgi:hypothetical protein